MHQIEVDEKDLDWEPLWGTVEIAVVQCDKGKYHGVIRMTDDEDNHRAVHPGSFDDPDECRRIAARDWATVEWSAAKLEKGEAPLL